MVIILCKQCLCKQCRRICVTSRTLGSVDEALNSRLLKALGQRIRELRTERGYSQESFADHCGVHRTFMGTIERGESNLSFQNIVKVATALGVTLSTLFLDLEPRAKAPEEAPKARSAKASKRNEPVRRAR